MDTPTSSDPFFDAERRWSLDLKKPLKSIERQWADPFFDAERRWSLEENSSLKITYGNADPFFDAERRWSRKH